MPPLFSWNAPNTTINSLILLKASRGDEAGRSSLRRILDEQMRRIGESESAIENPIELFQLTAARVELPTPLERDVSNWVIEEMASLWRENIIESARDGVSPPVSSFLARSLARLPSDVDWNRVAIDVSELSDVDPRLLKLIDLRIFAQLSTRQLASVFSRRICDLERDWRVASAWLKCTLANCRRST